MKLTETHAINHDGYERDGKGSVTITLDDGNGFVRTVDICAGESEDATFNRDLVGALSIADLIKTAFDAGRRGESLDYEFIDENEGEAV